MDTSKEQSEKQLRETSRSGTVAELTKLLETTEISCQDSEGFTSLHYAAAGNNILILKLLISKGAKINCVSKNGCTPLYVASQSGYIDTVTELIENKAEVDVTTKSTRHTALLVAAEFGYNYVVRKLLLSGANRHHKMNKGFTALHISAQHGQTETIQLLLQEGCNIDSLTESNWTPFMIAIWNEQHQAAEELKSHGANVHLKNQAGNTALALAAVKHTHLVKLCLSAGCDVNTQEFELNWTPLHVAAATGKQDVVKTLLTHSANVNIPDRRGNTPLHLAAHQGYRNVVATLIEAGADVFALNAGNLTSLDIAKERMYIEIVRDLLTSIERSNYKHATGYPWS